MAKLPYEWENQSALDSPKERQRKDIFNFGQVYRHENPGASNIEVFHAYERGCFPTLGSSLKSVAQALRSFRNGIQRSASK